MSIAARVNKEWPTWPEMIRDRNLYRVVRRRCSFEEHLLLIDFSDGDYRKYQARLFHLAQKKGIPIPSAK